MFKRKNAAQFKTIPFSGPQESRIYDAQVKYIRRKFGAAAASNINLGWGIGDTSITSKVYGHGVVESSIQVKRVKGKRVYRIRHQFESF